MATTYEVGGRTIEITHPDRVLFPDDGLTKADLAEYHHRVAPTLLRHLADRPLMLQRFPEGIDGTGFYQKEAGRGVPSWVRTVEARKEGGTVNHPVVDDEAALLALTNLGTISFHRWPSRADDLEHPDLLLVDLDPSDDDFDGVRRAARWTRDVLDELDLASYLQVTGSRGIHVVTPVDRAAPTEAAAAFAQHVARLLALRHPDALTDAGRKAKRRGRLYVDVARNGWAQTAVTPYSVRPRRGAPVATPITWDELEDPDLRPDGFTTATVPDRLAAGDDPWAGMGRRARSLQSRWQRLEGLVAEAEASASA
ncbi:ATP-dependent DNA ligase [Iamia sp. SCSIO 61187]|uniref:non-homologous end-joining DNA ligase n=1 Tax=Iamia sp. SCSIO 61187 TaxID=2722752 RepID=UPI001C62F49C|nr:non-homologous end-joining DNA ligase [Iamia sp. SCSIO 61187]QYG94895.1 ATP-dependent DNA ligase [Iamia sp. SCSIO 61187]